MSNKVEVRPPVKEEIDTLQEFWERHRRSEEGGSRVRTRDQLLHDCYLNPFRPQVLTSLLAWFGDRPIGHLAASDCPAYLKGKPQASAWWSGFYVLQEAGQYKAEAAVKLVSSVLRQPHAHAMVGIGGTDLQVLRLYEKLNFRSYGLVPFFYKIMNGQRVLRELRILRSRPWVASCASLAAAAWLPAKLAELIFVPRFLPVTEFSVQEWDAFPEAMDDLWSRVAPCFDLIFDHSSAYLNWRYDRNRYRRLGVFSGRSLVGVVVCKLTRMRENEHFGNLVVGTVVDVLCDPKQRQQVRHVLRAGVEHLGSLGAELIVANASHAAFCKGLLDCGFLKGPSNYMFLTKGIAGPDSIAQCHITRGDSDGDYRL